MIHVCADGLSSLMEISNAGGANLKSCEDIFHVPKKYDVSHNNEGEKVAPRMSSETRQPEQDYVQIKTRLHTLLF